MPILLLILVVSLSTVSQIRAQNYIGDTLEIAKIQNASKAFSQAYMAEDIETLSQFYTADAKIMPPNAPIIIGQEAIFQRWSLPEGMDIILHKAIPEEIRIVDNYAHDYGIYKGITRKSDGTEIQWSGKYLIVWQHTEHGWKIYLDIWNNLPQ